MLVKIDQLQMVFDNNSGCVCRLLESYNVKGKKYQESDKIYIDDIKLLLRAGIDTVDIKYDEIIYSYFSTLYPAEFRIQYSSVDFFAFDREIRNIRANKYTFKT